MGRASAWQREDTAGLPGVHPASAEDRTISFIVVATILLTPFWLPSLLLVGAYSLSFATPFAAAAWIVWHYPSGRAAYSRQVTFVVEWLAVLLALLGAWLSIFVSPEPARAFRVLLPMAYGACMIVALVRVPPGTAQRIIVAVSLSGTVILAVGLAMAVSGIGQSAVMLNYRFKGFFENANQLALVIAALWPMSVALLINARGLRHRSLSVAMLMILFAALMLGGVKTGIAVALAGGCVVWLYHAARSGTAGRAIISLSAILLLIALLIPLVMWTLSWASPITYQKVQAIVSGGLTDYQSIRARNLLWQESIRAGMANLGTGVGAGTKVLGRSHSHNMVLDYFRGMGILGLASALLLFAAAMVRTLTFMLRTLSDGRENRAADTFNLSLFVGAVAYLIGNQISDSFSPSTAFIFWMVYCSAVVSAGRTVRPEESPTFHSTRLWTTRARSIQTSP